MVKDSVQGKRIGMLFCVISYAPALVPMAAAGGGDKQILKVKSCVTRVTAMYHGDYVYNEKKIWRSIRALRAEGISLFAKLVAAGHTKSAALLEKDFAVDSWEVKQAFLLAASAGMPRAIERALFDVQSGSRSSWTDAGWTEYEALGDIIKRADWEAFKEFIRVDELDHLELYEQELCAALVKNERFVAAVLSAYVQDDEFSALLEKAKHEGHADLIALMDKCVAYRKDPNLCSSACRARCAIDPAEFDEALAWYCTPSTDRLIEKTGMPPSLLHERRKLKRKDLPQVTVRLSDDSGAGPKIYSLNP